MSGEQCQCDRLADQTGKELIGLRTDNESDYFTAMWVKLEDVFGRPMFQILEQ